MSGDPHVAIQTLIEFLQVGSNVDGTDRFSLEHDRTDQFNFVASEHMHFDLSRGKRGRWRNRTMPVTRIRGERLAVRHVDYGGQNVWRGLQRRKSGSRGLWVVKQKS